MKSKISSALIFVLFFGFSITVSADYNFGNTTLRLGSSGESVKELQRFLNANTVLESYLETDGRMGRGTVLTLKKWQKSNGLRDDGVVGSKTKQKINLLLIANRTDLSLGLKKAFSMYKTGEISECITDGKIYYSGSIQAYDGGATVIDNDGNQVGRTMGMGIVYEGVPVDNCERIYVGTYPNIWGYSTVDKYNLKNNLI